MYAEMSFKRKIYRRAVDGRGRLGPKIEKLLKDKSFDEAFVGV